MIKNKNNQKRSCFTFSLKDNILKNNKLFGLWIYLMSDCIMFAVLFAVYAIITKNISILHLISSKFFDLYFVLVETFLLLLSSFICGVTVVRMNKKNTKMIYYYLILVFFLGLAFLFMEIYEFYKLFENGFQPNKHAFCSIFFTLIGTHGLHIFFGLIFLLLILYQIKKLGLRDFICTRILCFSLFWHFLDIIWICIFTFVYLNGAIE